MSSLTGYSANNPLRYLGPNVNLVTIVTRNREPTSADYRQPETGKLYPFGTEWIVGKDPTTGTFGDIWFLSKIEANVAYWERLSDGGQTITGDTGGALNPTSGNWNIIGQTSTSGSDGNVPIQVMDTVGSGSTLRIEDRTSTTSFVVDGSSTVGNRGTFQTIQAAIDQAISGQTIFIRSGVYIEDITLKAGVNLAAYGNSGFTPTVTIKGKISYNQSGVCTISGLLLTNNPSVPDYAISVNGTTNSSLYLIECNLVAENFAALEMSSTGIGSSSARVRIVNSWCRTNAGAASSKFFDVTGTGGLTFWNVNVIDNDTPQTTASTFASSGGLLVKYSIIRFPIATSGDGRISGTSSEFNTFQGDSVCLDIGGLSTGFRNYLRSCILISDTNSVLSVGEEVILNMIDCTVITQSSTPIDITGGAAIRTLRQSGTKYLFTDPIDSSTTITLEREAFDPGKLWGNWDGTAPEPGYVGEQISSFKPYNGAGPLAPVALTTNIVADVTSIILTPGVWDVTGIVMFTGLGTASTRQNVSIGSGSGVITQVSYGNNTVSATFSNSTQDDVSLSVPAFRELVAKGTTTTMYLKARAEFSVGAVNTAAYGRISATRVC